MSKLTVDKIPNMKPKAKSKKKLGLLTPDRRRMVSFKLDNKTIENILELVEYYKSTFFYSLTKTDIMESSLLYFLSKNEEEQLALLQQYGKGRKKGINGY